MGTLWRWKIKKNKKIYGTNKSFLKEIVKYNDTRNWNILVLVGKKIKKDCVSSGERLYNKI